MTTKPLTVKQTLRKLKEKKEIGYHIISNVFSWYRIIRLSLISIIAKRFE